MILRIFLALLLLLAMAGSWLWVQVENYQPPEHSGINRVEIELGTFELAGMKLEGVSLRSKLIVTLEQYPQDIPSLLEQEPEKIKIKTVTIPYDGGVATLSDITLNFETTKEPQQWQGEWLVDNVTATKLPYPIPAMLGAGRFTLSQEKADITGAFRSAKNDYRIRFVARQNLKDFDKRSVQLTGGQMPFEGGVIELERGNVYFSGSNRFDGVMTVKDIKLSTLLDSFMEGKVTATGSVSGRLPVRITASGVPIVKDAQLKAADNGRIMLQPGALPSGNEQLAMVSDILGNFTYDTLSIDLSSDDKQELAATLRLYGHNPDKYEGRAVKLNVHLSGDLLSLIQHSLLMINDPKQLLKKDAHESP